MKTKNLIIAIASGKGGTGKTLISTHAFDALMRAGETVKLIDCDSEEPNDSLFFDGKRLSENDVLQKNAIIDVDKCTFCGKCHEYCNYHAIFYLPPAKMIHVIDELCHACGACSVACQYGAVTEKDVSLGSVSEFEVQTNAILVETRMRVGVMTPVPLIKAGLKKIQKESWVVLDSPPGTSCPFIQTTLVADYVVLITEPTPFGLSDLKQSVETLKTMNKHYGVIINRSGIGNREIYDYLQDEDIELLLEIPFDREIAYHYSKGELLTQYKPDFQEKLLKLFYYLRENYGTGGN